MIKCKICSNNVTLNEISCTWNKLYNINICMPCLTLIHNLIDNMKHAHYTYLGENSIIKCTNQGIRILK